MFNLIIINIIILLTLRHIKFNANKFIDNKYIGYIIISLSIDKYVVYYKYYLFNSIDWNLSLHLFYSLISVQLLIFM